MPLHRWNIFPYTPRYDQLNDLGANPVAPWESGRMRMTSNIHRALRLAGPVALLAFAPLASVPARADFFDDARKTFTTDIPHFFQDDIPCAFGGQPTSHTKSTCHGTPHPVRRTSDDDRAPAADQPDQAPPETQETAPAPPDSAPKPKGY